MKDNTAEKSTSLSRLLRDYRKRQSLTLEQVAEHLNLSLEQLKKLEQDDWIPEKLSTFERGYVRNYARLLKIEASVVESYFADCHYQYSALHSVKVYGCSTHKPLWGRLIVKWIVLMVVLGVGLALVISVFPGMFEHWGF